MTAANRRADFTILLLEALMIMFKSGIILLYSAALLNMSTLDYIQGWKKKNQIFNLNSEH